MNHKTNSLKPTPLFRRSGFNFSTHRSRVRTLALVLLGSAFIFSAGAAPITWTNTSGGLWSVAANWSPNTVPIAGSDVFITNNGTYIVTLDVSPTISSITLGGVSGQQTLTNFGKTMTLSLASLVNSNGVLSMNSGTLVGQTSLSNFGLVQCNGGGSGNGFAVTVQSNAVMNLLGGVTFAGPVTNSGTVNWLGGSVTVQNNGGAFTGEFWNQTNGLFDIQCSQNVTLTFSFGIFHNAGVVRKEIVAGTTSFFLFFDNTGTVQSKLGTITFSGGSNLGGTFQADAGAAIAFSGGTYTLSASPNFQGPGTVQFTSGNMTLNAFVGTLTLNGIGLVGQNTIAATSVVNLNGTGLNGGASLTVASNAVLNLQAVGTISGTMTNFGTVNWLGGAITLFNNGSSGTGEFWNQTNALFEIQSSQSMTFVGTSGNFHNAGLVRKEIVAGTTTFSVFFDNTGTVQTKLGTISFSSGSNLGGTFQADAGAAINFSGGNYTLSAPPNSFQGPGTVQLTGGTVTLNAFVGTFTLNGISLVGQNTVSSAGVVSLNGGGLNAGGSLTLASNAVLNVQTAATFSSPVTIASNAVMNLQAGATISSPMTNSGTVNWLGGGITIFNNGSNITGEFWNQAGALFEIQSGQSMIFISTSGNFHNAGLVRKEIVAGNSSLAVFFDNTGTVQSKLGTIFFSSGGILGGPFQADAGAVINFTGGTYTLSAPPNFQGPGTVQFTSGNMTLNAFVGTFTLNGISLVGQNTIAPNGVINLNGSSLSAGGSLTLASNAVMNLQTAATFSSPVTIASSAVMNLQAGATISSPMTNSGTVNWLGGSVTIFNNGSNATGEFWNKTNGLFEIQSSQSMTLISTSGNFHNAGLVRKEIVAGNTTFSVFFDNTGTVQTKLGTISFSSGSNLGGTFQADASTAINFIGSTYTLNTPPNFQGPGAVQIANSTLNGFTGTFTLSGSTMVGQNTISGTGTINLNGSNLGSGATLTVASNGVLNIQAATTFSGVLTNQGTVNWQAGIVSLQTNGVSSTGAIRNQAGALFDIQCDQALNNITSLASFINVGTLRKSAGTNTTAITVKLDNTGTIQARTGVIGVQGPYSESAAVTLAISLSTNTVGAGFGKIQFTAKPTFVGKFTVNILGGYRPNPGNSFAVLGFPSAAGDFTSFEGLDLGGGLRLTPRFTGSGLTLVATSYLVSAVPSLTLDRTVNGLLLAWPTNFTGWQLQSTTNLTAPAWLANVPVTGTNSTILSYAGTPQKYFRLFQ